MTQLKIICLEEHFADGELSEAVKPVVKRIAPYIAGLGTILEENPDVGIHHRPLLQGPARAERLAAAPFEKWLQDMDANSLPCKLCCRPSQFKGFLRWTQST